MVGSPHFARLADRLAAVLKAHLATGKRPLVPEAGALIWSMFCDLSAARTMGMAGPNPISYVDIEAWARLHRWPLQRHHIALLRAMDDAWIEQAYAKMSRPEGGKTMPRGSGQAVTAELFDLVVGR